MENVQQSQCLNSAYSFIYKEEPIDRLDPPNFFRMLKVPVLDRKQHAPNRGIRNGMHSGQNVSEENEEICSGVHCGRAGESSRRLKRATGTAFQRCPSGGESHVHSLSFSMAIVFFQDKVPSHPTHKTCGSFRRTTRRQLSFPSGSGTVSHERNFRGTCVRQGEVRNSVLAVEVGS